MFGNAFQIAKVRGIPIRVHFTLLIVLPIFGYNFAEEFTAHPLTWGMLAAITLFVSVALHELGHSFVAIAKGFPVRDIILLPIGGIASLARIPERPRDEFAVAIAGPLVSLTLAGALYGLGASGVFPANSDAESFCDALSMINISLFVFNLLPAFPMDGGRILRAALAKRKGRLEATRIAARCGKICALLFAIVGIWGWPGVVPPSIMLVIIAVFIYFSAGAEYRQVLMQEMPNRPPPIFQWMWSDMRRQSQSPPPPAEPADNEVVVSPPPWQRKGSTRTDLKSLDEP
ncbi:MAG: site-2 protease family protein [Kiritimatiellaeota bacterium]|nr:site-2 protease family protein [Kiritimatiellota bacterium]